MMPALRRRLTLLITLLTSLVLAGALLVTWRLAGAQYRTGAEALFTSAMAGLTDKLEQNDVISDVWLARQEAAAHCVIWVEDNGVPLQFDGAWEPQTPRPQLRALAAAAAGAAGLAESAVLRQQVSLTLTGEAGEVYQGAAAILPRPGGKYVRVFLLQDTAAIKRHLGVMALQYAALWLLGTAALAGAGWWLAGRALAPTEKALQKQREFVAAASHELRSPLAVIKASLAAAVAPGTTPQSRAVFMENAGQEVDRMARLTGDLLLLAGGDAGAWQAKLAPLPLDGFCIQLYEQYEPLARQSGRRLRLALPGEPLPAVPADEGRLRQLLETLLNNALDYAPAGTAVELCAEVEKNSVQLLVKDHGPGVPDAQKQAVFERFYRADGAHSDKAHFGLGLAVAKELAALHRAALTVEDTPGGGATFRLALPKG